MPDHVLAPKKIPIWSQNLAPFLVPVLGTPFHFCLGKRSKNRCQKRGPKLGFLGSGIETRGLSSKQTVQLSKLTLQERRICALPSYDPSRCLCLSLGLKTKFFLLYSLCSCLLTCSCICVNTSTSTILHLQTLCLYLLLFSLSGHPSSSCQICDLLHDGTLFISARPAHIQNPQCCETVAYAIAR